MAENNIGSVVVMQDKKFLGIITERDYSRKVVLKGKGISEKTVTAILPNNNLGVLLQSLEVTLDVDIKQSGNNITISNKN